MAERRNMLELGEDIFSNLAKEEEAVTITHLQGEVGTGYGTLNRYIEFIEYVQSQPKIKIIAKSKRAKFIGMERIPTLEDLGYMRELFPKEDRGIEILRLLQKLKTEYIPLSVFDKKDQPIIKELEKTKRVVIKNSKVKLTKLGETIAVGAARIY